MSLNNVANVISRQNAIELLMAQIQYEDIYIHQTWTSLDHMNPSLPTTVEYFCCSTSMSPDIQKDVFHHCKESVWPLAVVSLGFAEEQNCKYTFFLTLVRRLPGANILLKNVFVKMIHFCNIVMKSNTYIFIWK